MNKQKESIWSFPYIVLMAVNLFQSMAAFMTNTTLPVYADALGATPSMVDKQKESIWSFPYIVLMAVNLFQSMAAFMTNTTLPVYADALGATPSMVVLRWNRKSHRSASNA